MSKHDVTKARAPKIKMTASKNKKTAGRIVKLNVGSWYDGAARSIGISNTRLLEKRNELIK